MWKTILVYAFIYVLVILFSFVSEIAYKKRSVKTVIDDSKAIWIKASLIFIVFLVASILYSILRIKLN